MVSDEFFSQSMTSSEEQIASTSSHQESPNRWFHGDISREESSHLLKGATPRAFLLWRAQPGNYYLSHSADSNSVQHLPIRLLSRQFYFCGEPFDSLGSIVEKFYEMYSNVEPVHCRTTNNISDMQPSSQSSSRRIAILPFNGLGTDELSVDYGDILSELYHIDSEWIYARVESTGSRGIIAASFLTPVKPEPPELCCTRPTDLPYYHTGNPQNFLRSLNKAGLGSFLVRSSTTPNCFVLLVNTGKIIQKFRIESEDGKWRLGPRLFDNFEEITDRYCQRPIADGIRLVRAVLSSSPPIIDSSTGSIHSIASTSTVSVDISQSSSSLTVVTSNPEDYNHNSSTITVASVHALRKSREEKNWKPCFLQLTDEPNEKCRLQVFDSDQSSRARLSLSLQHCHLYSLDSSLFGRDGCVYVGQNETESNGGGTYLCFRPIHSFLQWMELLRPRTLFLRPGTVPTQLGRPFEVPRISEVALLRCNLGKFKSDSLLRPDSLYTASLIVNGVRVYVTRPLSPSSVRNGQPLTVVFDAKFVMMYAPTGTSSLQLSLSSQSSPNGKRTVTSKSPIHSMPEEAELVEETDSGFSFSCTRIRLRVLSSEQYVPLLSIIRENNYELCDWTGERLRSCDRLQFAYSLWVSFLSKPRELQLLLKAVLTRTLKLAVSESPLRGDSFSTTFLTVGLRLAARSQLEDELDTVLPGIVKKNVIQSSDVDTVVDILRRIAEDPTTFRILSLVSEVSQEVFPDNIVVTHRVLSAVFVLRFANPVLLAQQQYGASQVQQLAKMVQTAANSAVSPSIDVESLSPAVSTFRTLFESIAASKTTDLIGVDNLSSCDHLAIVAHLLSTLFQDGSHSEECPIPLTQPVLRIIDHHVALL